MPHEIEDVSSDLAYRLGHPLRERSRWEAEVLMTGESAIGNKSERDARFGEFFLGIVDEAGVADVLMAFESGAGGVDVSLSFLDECPRLINLVPVECTYRIATGSDRRSTPSQRVISCRSLSVELRTKSGRKTRKIHDEIYSEIAGS